MEPVAAISLACNILQVVEFSTKVLTKSRQLRQSFSGILPENIELEKVVIHQRDLVQQLQKQVSTSVTTAQSQGYGGGTDLASLARLSIETANELLDVLERLKVRGNRTRWKSFRQAVKSLWKKEKVEEVLGRLQLIRDEIEFGVVMDLRDSLLTLSSEQSTTFDSLDQSTKTILQAVLDGQSASTAATSTQLQAVQDLSAGLQSLVISEHQQTRDEIIGEIRQQTAHFSNLQFPISNNIPYQNPDEQERTDILVTLRFHSIDNRHEAIPEAHRKTFEWIWAGQSATNPRWSNFWNWLTSEGGIYWVSGKAGSGKSTLMKYIYHDSRKSQGLEHWAGPGNEVVAAGFFFWNSGTVMQKSLLGLLQSILYEILQTRPGLKDSVFPTDVQKEITSRWTRRKQDAESIWTVSDLKNAFSRLIQIPSLKICLFIDGLDEFEGDHREVAELFMKIITSPSVKACLSSRPLVIFEQAFSRCPRLRLQDLTHDDIVLYVRGKLQARDDIVKMGATDPSEFDQLIEEIIGKASGVFLWVTLVVTSLLDGLTNFDRMVDLRIRLSEIPDDLSHLYWHILRRIKPAFYLGQAAKMLIIAYIARNLEIPLTVDLLAAAENYEPGKPLQWSFRARSLDERCDIVQGRLNSRCRGLLEVRNYLVVFLHQSVADFLAQPEVTKSLQQSISGQFNVHASLLAAFLTRIKYQPESAELYSYTGQFRMDDMFILTGKVEEENGAADIHLMEEFDEIVQARMMTDLNEPMPWNPKYWCWKDAGLHWAGITANQDHSRPPIWSDTFTSLCAQRGLAKYVSFKLDNGDSLHQGLYKRPLLDFMVDSKCLRLRGGRQPISQGYLELLCEVFDRGADPNEMFQGSAIWNNLLFHAYQDCSNWSSSQKSKYESLRLPSIHAVWIEIMSIFLQHGANPLDACTLSGSSENPAAYFVRHDLMPHCRAKGKELYDKLIAICDNEVHRIPREPRPDPPLCVVLPAPRPENVPHPGNVVPLQSALKSRGVIMTPGIEPLQSALKSRGVITPAIESLQSALKSGGVITPDSEGLIPVSLELALPVSPIYAPPLDPGHSSGYHSMPTPVPTIAGLDSSLVMHGTSSPPIYHHPPLTQTAHESAPVPVYYQPAPLPMFEHSSVAQPNYQPASTPVLPQPTPTQGYQLPVTSDNSQQPTPSPLHYRPTPSPLYQQPVPSRPSPQDMPLQTYQQAPVQYYHQHTPSQTHQYMPSQAYQQPLGQNYVQPTPSQTSQHLAPLHTYHPSTPSQTYQQPIMSAQQYVTANAPTQYINPPSSTQHNSPPPVQSSNYPPAQYTNLPANQYANPPSKWQYTPPQPNTTNYYQPQPTAALASFTPPTASYPSLTTPPAPYHPTYPSPPAQVQAASATPMQAHHYPIQPQSQPSPYSPYPAFAGPPPAPASGSSSGLLSGLKQRLRK